MTASRRSLYGSFAGMTSTHCAASLKVNHKFFVTRVVSPAADYGKAAFTLFGEEMHAPNAHAGGIEDCLSVSGGHLTYRGLASAGPARFRLVCHTTSDLAWLSIVEGRVSESSPRLVTVLPSKVPTSSHTRADALAYVAFDAFPPDR